MPEPLILPNGGYRKLRSFQTANLIYDATVAFCDRWIDRRSRTHDQMVQAARSGVQNIAEGSAASGTSKKTELKLTNVAKASQEELLLDYEAFLRQRELPVWPAGDRCVAMVRVARPGTLDELRKLMGVLVADHSDKSDRKAEVAANTMICLINQCTYLLRRQIDRLAADFTEDGGFTERLYQIRSEARKK